MMVFECVMCQCGLTLKVMSSLLFVRLTKSVYESEFSFIAMSVMKL